MGCASIAARCRSASLTAFLAYFTQILMAVLMATMTLVVLPRASVCAERITEVLSTRAAVENPPSPKFPLGGITGAVRLDGATFTYPGADRPVLQDISLTALPGTTTAIVGSTGSGKSTLVSLICRLYDVTAGAVLVDGVDVRDYHTERLWSAIGLVPQRGYLFSGTVADNLRYGAAPEQSYRRARCGRPCASPPPTDSCGPTTTGCRCASPRAASTSPAASGNGWRSRGRSSAGRRSTCSTTRSPRSTCTPTRGCARRWRETSADATIIVVTQRISTAAQADQVIVVDDGKLVGSGTHESLLADCATYAEFADSQSVGAGVRGTP